MKIAVEGCAHGELEKIYETIAFLETENNYKVDLLLCCGDFQASRNYADLECMAVPPKYRQLCTFYKYYSGELTAPMLTIIIGGNHEASNYFQELPYGGWVAPNIYYLGYAGVVQVGGVRIAGLSGIYKSSDYYKGRYEKVPYSEDTKRSCYHIRALDVFRLKQLSKPLNIMMSHDWPTGVYNHGNVELLLRRKPFFRKEVETNTLGSQPAAELLDSLQPDHWFSAHLHVKFPALVKHENESVTKFLALDKCLPRRQFLQVLDIAHEGDIALSYDLEWLTILHLTDHLTSVRRSSSYMPGPGCGQRWAFTPTDDEKESIRKRIGNDMKIPINFAQTALPHDPHASKQRPSVNINPQTSLFCNLVGVDDPMSLLLQQTPGRIDPSPAQSKHNYSSFQMSGDAETLETSWNTPVKHNTPRTSLNLPAPRTPVITPGTPVSISTPVSSIVSITESESSSLTQKLDSPVCPPSPSQLPIPTSLLEPPCNLPDSSEKEPDQVLKNENVGTDSPHPKRFRRRNLEMYASIEENE